MDLVKNEQATLHTRGINHREGSFRYKDLGQGTPGRPDNFYLRMVWTQGDFFSPRHMHNFDQVRVQIKGRFSFDKDGTMHPGCIGYFPEGTPYGPQTSAEDTIQLAMQIGGPSRSGYLSEEERTALMPARPWSLRDRGYVTWSSISRGERPIQSVNTITWFSDKSGIASTGV